MKQILSILCIVFLMSGCKKPVVDLNNQYVGNWNFEVIYTSINDNTIRETVVNCQGKIQKDKYNSTLKMFYCIDNCLKINIDNEGVVRTNKQNLLGVIDNETCLIIDNNPTEKSISKITIKGVR